jgi:hypothetical protein
MAHLDISAAGTRPLRGPGETGRVTEDGGRCLLPLACGSADHLRGAPGELFVVRKFGALVPPYQPDAGYHGTSPTLEFGVRVLKVSRRFIRKFDFTCLYYRGRADRTAQNQ